MKQTLRQVSRLALISLLLAGSDEHSSIRSSLAMEITDETTHEQVYSNPDSAESVASQLEKDIEAEQPAEGFEGEASEADVEEEGDEDGSELFQGTE